MKVYPPAVYAIQTIAFSLLLFSQYPLGSQATCNCDLSLHNGNVSLTERLSPPNFRMASFIPLTNIQPAINYHNLTELYVKVVERYQSLTIIKDLMVSDHYFNVFNIPGKVAMVCASRIVD